MSKKLLKVAVYPLLLVNLALGFFMFMLSYQIVLVILDLVRHGSVLDSEAQVTFSYARISISSIWVIILAVLALISFGLLDSYYGRRTDSWQHLLVRFLRIVAIQIVYICTIFIAIQLMITGRFIFDFGSLIVTVLLVIGIAILFLTRSKADLTAGASK